MGVKNLLTFFGGKPTSSNVYSLKDATSTELTEKNSNVEHDGSLQKLCIQQEDTAIKGNFNNKLIIGLPSTGASESNIECGKPKDDPSLEIHEILKTFFLKLLDNEAKCKINEQQLLYSIYLCLNRVGPIFEGLELGLGESILIRAVASSTGKSTNTIKSDVARLGDLGKVMQSNRHTQTTMMMPRHLTLSLVFKTLREIAQISGSNAISRKTERVHSLLVSCRGSEPKYLIRSLEGKLRIGLAEQSVLIALAQASVQFFHQTSLPSKSIFFTKFFEHGMEEAYSRGVSILKSVYSEIPDYERILPHLKNIEEGGISQLRQHVQMEPGCPIRPMLAHPTRSLTEVLDRFEAQSFTCEYKYDGERCQIHYLKAANETSPNTYAIFSRNLEEMSMKYLDVLAKLSRFIEDNSHLMLTSFVLDCEAVAWDPIAKKILPFQILSTRKRKDVTVENVQIQVVLFVFDLLFLNGKPLLRSSFRERRELLHSHFPVIEGEFYHAIYADCSAIDQIQEFLERAISDGCEGLMVKTLDNESSWYEPSKRSRNWLKIKKDYLNSTACDSLDLVVIGGYFGRGKRVGVYGGFLLASCGGCNNRDNIHASENDDSDEEFTTFQAICKLGTGFSELELEQHSTDLKNFVLQKIPTCYDITDNIRPDVWFEPKQVWEVKAADLSVSPLYTAARGLVDPIKGISLRFPRFIRVRTDKNPEDATRSSLIAEMYNAQMKTLKSSSAKDENDDFY